MNLSELLNGPMGQSVINNVANQMGMDQREASNAVGLALPVILSGMQRNALSERGAQSLNNALNDPRHDGSILNNLGSLFGGNTQATTQDGNKILGHIFGSQKPAVEQGISKKTGISMQKIGPLLAILAPIVMGYLSREKQQTNTSSGGLGDLLGGLLGGGQTQTQAQPQTRRGGGLMDMVGGMLDKDGDGNIVDDLLGGFLGGRR